MLAKTNIPAGDMQLFQSHYMSRILLNNRQETFVDRISFFLHVMSIILKNLLFLLLSVNPLGPISADCSKLST